MSEPADPLQREAIAWVVKLTSGDVSPADAEALRVWRRQSKHHDAAYRQAADTWQLVGEAACPTPVVSLHAPRRPVVTRRSMLRRTALAASVAGIAATGAFLLTGPSVPELLADHRTATGA